MYLRVSYEKHGCIYKRMCVPRYKLEPIKLLGFVCLPYKGGSFVGSHLIGEHMGMGGSVSLRVSVYVGLCKCVCGLRAASVYYGKQADR